MKEVIWLFIGLKDKFEIFVGWNSLLLDMNVGY